MAHDPLSDDDRLTLPVPAPRPGLGARGMLFAGVAGACALGVGAGLWARPAESERRTTAAAVAAKVAEAPRRSGKIEIVVDETPAPIGAPIEVLPAMTGQAQDADALVPAPPAEPEPLAPVRPPAGLVRVQTVEPLPVEAALPPPAPRPAAAAARKPEPAKAEAKAAPKPKVHAAPPRLAEAKARKDAHAGKPRPAEKADAPRDRKGESRLAKAEAKLEKALKAKDLQLAKARLAKEKVAQDKVAKDKVAKDRAEKVRMAKAKAVKAEAMAEAKKPSRLAKLLTKVTHPSKAAEKPKVAQARPPKKLKTEKAVLKREPRPAPTPARPAKIKRDASFRLASNRCVSSDPGEALVCADAGLGAADRQLTRAYRQAEAAGVSAATLQRQQARWIAARAQAAREAPWAVRDVYEARIAELNDQTRDAHREY